MPVAATLSTSQTPYCTVAQAAGFFDFSFWSGLIYDGSVEGTIPPTLSQCEDGTSAAGIKCQMHLMVASGRIEAAACRGERYMPADLLALAQSSPDNAGANWLRYLTACLFVGGLEQRRDPTRDKPGILLFAEEQIKLINDGELVFGILESQAAGLPASVDIDADNGVANTIGLKLARMLGRHDKQEWVQ